MVPVRVDRALEPKHLPEPLQSIQFAEFGRRLLFDNDRIQQRELASIVEAIRLSIENNHGAPTIPEVDDRELAVVVAKAIRLVQGEGDATQVPSKRVERFSEAVATFAKSPNEFLRWGLGQFILKGQKGNPEGSLAVLLSAVEDANLESVWRAFGDFVAPISLPMALGAYSNARMSVQEIDARVPPAELAMLYGGTPSGNVRREKTVVAGLVGAALSMAVVPMALMSVVYQQYQYEKNARETMNESLVAAESERRASSLVPPPLIDPFGNAPVDLRPMGPIPEGPIGGENPGNTRPASPPVAAPSSVSPQFSSRPIRLWFCSGSNLPTLASLTSIQAKLESLAGEELVVRGYADTAGPSADNVQLSGSRATVVADFLRTKGLTVTDFTGVGELEGLDDNQNCANQRRVDVWVKGGPAEAPSRACAPEPDVESLVCG